MRRYDDDEYWGVTRLKRVIYMYVLAGSLGFDVG
jgi:hypothetical protein